jgi:hypothetical protein
MRLPGKKISLGISALVLMLMLLIQVLPGSWVNETKSSSLCPVYENKLEGCDSAFKGASVGLSIGREISTRL